MLMYCKLFGRDACPVFEHVLKGRLICTCFATLSRSGCSLNALWESEWFFYALVVVHCFQFTEQIHWLRKVYQPVSCGAWAVKMSRKDAKGATKRHNTRTQPAPLGWRRLLGLTQIKSKYLCKSVVICGQTKIAQPQRVSLRGQATFRIHPSADNTFIFITWKSKRRRKTITVLWF